MNACYTCNSSGECVFNQSANAAFKRDCQRGPVARNASSTSLSSLTVVGVFALPTGRPRRLTLSPSRSSAPSIHSSVISGVGLFHIKVARGRPTHTVFYSAPPRLADGWP